MVSIKMKTDVLMIIGIIVIGLSAVAPSFVYGLEIPMTADDVLEYFDLIVLGTITDVKNPEHASAEFSIGIEQVIKPKSFTGQTVTALGCDTKKSYRGTSCPYYEKGQRGLFLISKTDDGNVLSSASKISEANCTAEDFLANYRGLEHGFFLTQDGQSDVFFTGKPVEIHYVIANRDMNEKDYSLKLNAYSGNPVFSDVLNGTLSDCTGFVDVVSSFVPTKMGTYGFNAEHDDGGESFYGLAIIDYDASPLKQSRAGIHAQDTWCKEDFILVLKHDDTPNAIFDNKPACVKPYTVSKLAERDLIELSSFYNNRPLIERLYIGMAILQFSDVPIFMMGLYDDDQVLGIGISKDESDKIQNAEDYFDRTIRETIPFDVPLRITFDKYWGG